MIKTKQCDECIFSQYNSFGILSCKKEHKPKFYLPKNELDTNWGWKRKCEDYKERTN